MDWSASTMGFHPAQASLGPVFPQAGSSVRLTSNAILHFVPKNMSLDGIFCLLEFAFSLRHFSATKPACCQQSEEEAEPGENGLETDHSDCS